MAIKQVVGLCAAVATAAAADSGDTPVAAG